MANDGIVLKSMGWSAIGEMGAKCITPVSTLILARLLTPTDFGVIAVCNMILFFLEIIIDAGFSKYIVQHKFKDEVELDNYSSTAFWSNLGISFICWLLVISNINSLAIFVGGRNYANVIAVTAFQLVIVAMLSTQLALLRRSFKYKKLCYVRIISACIPLMVTVPLAYYIRSFWSLVIGSFTGYIFQLLCISFLCKWKPSIHWSFYELKQMFSFSFWSLCEGLAHWLIMWIDTLILTNRFDTYYVGLYKNSSAIIMSLFLMISSSVVPVLFSTLSRIDSEQQSFDILLHIERLVIYILFPIALIVWFNRTIITYILLGNQWGEASFIVGMWAVMMAISITIYSFPAEAFKAKGKPMYLFLYQLSYLMLIVPICYKASLIGFWDFVYARFTCALGQVALFVIFTKIFLHWHLLSFIKNMIKPFLSIIPLIIINLSIRYIPIRINEISLLIINGLIGLLMLFCFRNDIKKLFVRININPNTL